VFFIVSPSLKVQINLSPYRSSGNRRSFLKKASAFGLLWSTHRVNAQQMPGMNMPAPSSAAGRTTTPPRVPRLVASSLASFVDPLPMPEVLRPNAAGHVRVTMREVHAKLHRDLPPTRLWSYGNTQLAPLLEAHSGHPLRVEWMNQLPTKHFLPVDFSLHGCGHDVPEVRACVHMHGGRTPSADDGQPEDWYVPGHSRVCTYPLEQDATALWYHDHAMGLNRLNTYAGLFGMTIVRDHVEDALKLPSGRYEVPLLLCDRLLTTDGQLFYPDSGDPNHPWVPEFAGDAILANGKIRPYLEVQPRLYRIRLLNAANSRFFNLALSNKQAFHQIGSDQGLLSAPVELHKLTIAPAERADLLIDFSKAAGQQIMLRDNFFDVMQFRVAKKASSGQARTMPQALRTIERIPETSAIKTRTLSLNEFDDQYGNSMLMLIDRKHWHEPVTEKVKLNTTEIWEFANLTEDTHPMHLHLVRFQVLDRRAFDEFTFGHQNVMRYQAAAIPPEPQERGWKDVVQCLPGMVTRIIVNFDGYPGKYLYHCHVLEHEANDMMRPFEVIA